MGLLRWLLSLFRHSRPLGDPVPEVPAPVRQRRPVWLAKFRRSGRARLPERPPFVETLPYSFARRAVRFALPGRKGRGFYDLAGDIDRSKLRHRNLPELATPDDIAAWLGLPVGKVAWLAGRLDAGGRPSSRAKAHYVYQWKAKRSGGGRLIESPKPLLKEAQTRILRDILDQIPPHPAAHGFAKGRSIATNAKPHCGQAVVVKWDLANFYPSVRFNRVVAIFRSLGYSREAAVWLASLTTSTLPMERPTELFGVSDWDVRPYLGRHLPQGAPTSPALANLSAYSLDVRLSGLARKFGGTYTRYADDLTISGDERFARTLRTLIPLVQQVIRRERFRVHPTKRKVLRSGQRQVVAGVVVNEKPNVARDEFDRLKAILRNAIKHRPASQHRDRHPAFAEHLRGRIAHVAMLNPARGAKLARLYDRIDFG